MDEPQENEGKTRTITLLGREITMPQSRLLRIVIGGLLVFLGCFGFLPVLGFWMIPVGLVILSYEFATVRRWRRRSEVWWAEKRGRRRARERQPLDKADRR
ncbi:PGPGW domain-containing protein [Neoaquamicrobium sediminum]|uniref:PGPGW domain-containing protein n=1 Tax=Neoaquamicrobium sediminum TaxID=1849104 RepID=UPI001FD5DFD5|nr:PGPGW domain-containing protein [Mesorhizobium sediminum]